MVESAERFHDGSGHEDIAVHTRPPAEGTVGMLQLLELCGKGADPVFGVGCVEVASQLSFLV